jgi:predicted MFS family arabinose efflux permease
MKHTSTTSPLQTLDPGFVFLLSFICAVTVGNIYLAQPLLAEIATTFNVNAEKAGSVATLTQIGYGLGVLLIVPMGDLRERKSLILFLLLSVTIFLLIAGFSPSIFVLCAASLFVGIATTVPQIIIPYAASLAKDGERAAVIGKVQAGLLIGILLARTVSGAVAGALGWRSAYIISAVLMILMMIIITITFPKQEVNSRMSYLSVIRSMGTLLRQETVLQKVCLMGFFNFGIFGIFWTSLTFLLKTNFNLGPSVAGLFGLIGVVGALAASFSGRISDRQGPSYVQRISAVVTLISFVIFYFAGQSFVLLVLGVIVMDAGVQANHISSQAQVFSINPNARSRLNGVYMFFRFLGGATGSSLGALSWNQGGWTGVCTLGIIFSILTFTAFFFENSSGLRAKYSIKIK